MRRRIIGTFHKTGTVLWRKIAWQANREGVVRVWDLNNCPRPPEVYNLILATHAYKISPTLEKIGEPLTEDDRAIVCIRDPRDIIVSAAHYHCRTTEKWCHKPRKDFNGLTYQEKINSLNSLQDKFLFEMDNSAGRVIKSMERIAKDLHPAKALILKLEDLIVDDNLYYFHKAFSFLGLDCGKIADMLAISTENSFFSNPKAFEERKHARTNSSAIFKNEFTPETLDVFYEKFPNALELVGYPSQGYIRKSPRSEIDVKLDGDGIHYPRRNAFYIEKSNVLEKRLNDLINTTATHHSKTQLLKYDADDDVYEYISVTLISDQLWNLYSAVMCNLRASLSRSRILPKKFRERQKRALRRQFKVLSDKPRPGRR